MSNREIRIAIRRLLPMTPEQEREQVISFAYGNVKMANPKITKDDIRRAVAELEPKP